MERFDENRFYEAYTADPQRAFVMLMDGFRDKVIVLCHRVSRTNEVAEELAQDVFIRAWKGLPKFRRESSLSTWIYHITWNVCASHIEQKKTQTISASYDEIEEEDSPSFRFAVDDPEVDRFEKRQYLDKLFNLLPFQHKIVLTLYYYQEQSYEEISKITGWPLGTVKATLHRAKSALRTAAQKMDGEHKKQGGYHRPPNSTIIEPISSWENRV